MGSKENTKTTYKTQASSELAAYSTNGDWFFGKWPNLSSPAEKLSTPNFF